MPLRLLFLLVLAVWLAPPCLARDGSQPARETARALQDPDALLSAVVHIKMKALPGARSSSNLGAEREGTGVVIDARGHVLTIGYIVVEAESIELTSGANRTVPAVLAAYDHGTGFALLRAAKPLVDVTPIELGSSEALELHEPVMVLPYGGRESVSLAYVMSKRKFTASWEYMLDSAIFTSPPSMKWTGAALVNREGRLVGIGSLLVRAVDSEQQIPGNMFVPIDILKPILADLMAKGRRSEPARPWLGLGTEELQGHLLVTNVSPGGPAERAGIRRGDIVVSVGSAPVRGHEEFYRRMWSSGAAGTEIALKILQGAELKDLKVHSIDRFEYFRDKQ